MKIRQIAQTIHSTFCWENYDCPSHLAVNGYIMELPGVLIVNFRIRLHCTGQNQAGAQVFMTSDSFRTWRKINSGKADATIVWE